MGNHCAIREFDLDRGTRLTKVNLHVRAREVIGNQFELQLSIFRAGGVDGRSLPIHARFRLQDGAYLLDNDSSSASVATGESTQANSSRSTPGQRTSQIPSRHAVAPNNSANN
jgi:hypothetical protein